MLGNITGWHALILLAVIILLFGATRLPALARSVGQSARIFRSEVKPDKDEVVDAGAVAAPVVAPSLVPPVSASPATAHATAPFTDGAHAHR